jgi:hypothetical protein
MITLKETSSEIGMEPQNWCMHLMNFVDDFRYYKDASVMNEPFELIDPRMDALLASTAEYLCDEQKLDPPAWLDDVPGCDKPFFVGELQNLKAISIVESPLRFRMRKVFVLENFLSRV